MSCIVVFVVFSVLWQTDDDAKTYKQTLQDLHMLTLLMFLTLSCHLLERKGETKTGTKSTKTARSGRHSYIHNYVPTDGQIDRDEGFDGKCLRTGGNQLSEAADYKNSHHIACTHLHRCSVSAIPVLGFVGNSWQCRAATPSSNRSCWYREVLV